MDRTIRTAVWCLLTGLGTLVAAQGQTNVEADLDRVMPLSLADLVNLPVVTASRQAETSNQTPSHILVFTREQIRERRYRNLADLMADLPGVDFMEGTKSSAYNNFTVQGHSGPTKLLLMLDGVRIGNPAGGSYPLAENLALYMARQVEVLFGPAAALYGADAMAGVVNIITDHADAAGGHWLSVGGGNFGSREASFRTHLQLDGGWALSVSGHAQAADRAPLQDYYPADFPRKNATTLGGTVVVPAAQRENYVGGIRSQSLYAHAELGPQIHLGLYRNQFRSLTSTGDKPETALYLDDAPWITQTTALYGKASFDWSPDVSGEWVADYSVQELDPQSRYVNIYTSFASGYEYTSGKRLSLEHNLHWRMDERHRLQAGLGWQRYEAIEAHTLPSPYDTGKSSTGQGLFYRNTNLPLAIYDANYGNASLYGQLQSHWNPAWSTMAGVRVDHHTAYGTSVNPRVGAVWRASEQHILKALYGRSFRAPSPEETLSSFGSFDGSKTADGLYRGTGFRVPNFHLEPEKSQTLSLTWDYRPSSDLNLVANAYRSQVENLIVTQVSSAVNSIPGALLIAPENKGNAGQQTQQGLDLLVRMQSRLSSAWSADWWGSASWVHGRLDEGDGVLWDLPWVAKHKLKLGATLRYLDRFSITPQWQWVGDTTNGRKRDRNAPPDRLETPGYRVANLHLGWHKLLGGKATLWLDVDNCFDERYYVAHGSGSRTFFNMPQQPRTWSLTLDYRF